MSIVILNATSLHEGSHEDTRQKYSFASFQPWLDLTHRWAALGSRSGSLVFPLMHAPDTQDVATDEQVTARQG